MKLRVLIADDELMARKRLTRLLGTLDDVEIAGDCATGAEVLEWVQESPVDVVLLDIHMPELTGVDTLGLLGDDGPTVVFTTAHPDYALQAFEGGAVDYLLKPIDAGRLKKALERVRARQRPVDPVVDRLPVSTRKGIVLLDPATLSHAVIDGASVLLHTEEARFVTDFRLAELERRLQAHPFERVHRKALVNLDFVERLETVDTGGYIAHMRGGGRVAVSRQSARRLRRRLGLPR